MREIHSGSLAAHTVAQLMGALAMTVCELRGHFFVSLKYVYKFDCFTMMIHWISKEASTQAYFFLI